MRLVFRPEARDELIAARDWYEACRPDLGFVFAEAVETTLERIQELPRAFPAVHGEIRRAVLRRFPYAVFFRLLDDELVILGVVHSRRDPGSWRSRR